MTEYGPTTKLAQETHKKKHRLKGESFKEACSRISAALTESKEEFYSFREVLLNQRFIPGGRIQSSVGSPKSTTAFNCFVSDRIEDSMEGIMEAASKAATTMRLGGGIGFDFCVSPDTKILCSNLSWKNAVDIKVGDKVVGFPENINLQKNKFEVAVVESNESLMQPVVEVVTDQGSTKVSETHMFVVRRYRNRPHKKKSSGYQWVAAFELEAGDEIAFVGNPWDKSEWDTHDSGWFSGMMDGEGWISKNLSSTGTTRTRIGIAQNRGAVNDKIKSVLDKYGVEYTTHIKENKNNTLEAHLLGGTWQAAKIWGVCKPIRWNPEDVWVGSKLSTKSNKPAIVSSIRHLGRQRVYAVKTSTRTLITDGYLSHNSTIRPKGARIKKLEANSSGAVSFMRIFDSVCDTIRSAGNRRGAMMGVLRIDHPDIEEFISAKQNEDQLTNFNMSIAVTDLFMNSVKYDLDFNLVFNDIVYDTVRARFLWDKIMRSTWDFSEPGVLFIDQMNRMNNLWYCETLSATNP